MEMATFSISLVVGSWVVVMLTKVVHVPATRAGLMGSLVLLLGIVSRPLGGALRRHMGIRTLFVMSLLMIAVGCFVFVAPSVSFGPALMAVILIGTGCGLPYAAMFSRAGALFPGRTGTPMGLVNMIAIATILPAPPLLQHLPD